MFRQNFKMYKNIFVILFLIASLSALCVSAKVGGGRPMMGGRRAFDMSNEENRKLVDSLIEFSLTKLGEQRTQEAAKAAGGKVSADFKPLKYSAVSLIGDVESQVVAGANYYFKLKVKEAECTDKCKYEVCEMTVWDKPWENFRELTNVVCKKKSHSLGGKRKISPDNKEARKALHFAVLKMNKESNELFYSKPVSVNQAYKQVVSGIKYTVVFDYGKTECKKNEGKLLSHAELSECATKANEKSQVCKVIVVDKPWLKDSKEESRYQVMNSDCVQSEE